MANKWILALAIGTSRGAMAIGHRTQAGAVELHEANADRIGSGIGPATAEKRLATVAALIQQSTFLRRHPEFRVHVRLAKPRPQILLEDLVRKLLGPNLEDLTHFDLVSQCLLNVVRASGQTTHRVGLIDVGCYHTEFASECASRGTFQTIIRVGSVHITNDISIGLRTPMATAEKLKRRFGLGHDPEIHPSLESQVYDTGFYEEIVRARVSEILALLERQFPNDVSIRDLAGGLWTTGGGSKLPGLRDFLEKKYSLPVKRMSDLSIPWSGAVIAPEETWPAVSLLYADFT